MGKRGMLSGLLLLMWAMAAQGGPDPVEEAAVRVLETYRTREDLTSLAARTKPDLWLVADRLCAKGEKDAALALATAARGKDFEGLSACLLRWKPDETEARWRDALERGKALIDAKKAADGLAALAEVGAGPDTILGIWTLHNRGVAHGHLRDLAKSAVIHGEAGRRAEKIGWLRRAALSFSSATASAHARADIASAIQWSEALLRVQRARGNRLGEAQALVNRGGLRQTAGRLAAAATDLSAAIEVLEPLAKTDPTAAAAHAVALINLSRVRRSDEDFAQAVTIGRRAIEALEKLRNRPYLAWALANLGETELRRGEPRLGLEPLERACSLMKEIGDTRGEALTLVFLGQCRAAVGDSEDARKLLEAGLARAEAAGARWALAHACKALGVLTASRGPMSRALEHQERALGLYRELGDQKSEVWLLTEMALTLDALGRTDRANEARDRALELAEHMRYRHGLVAALNRVGGFHEVNGEYAEAVAAARRAHEIAESMGFRSGMADALVTGGVARWRLGEFRTAIRDLEEARTLYRAIGNQVGYANALHNLSLVHVSSGRLGEALAAASECVEIQRARGSPTAEAKALANLAVYHLAGGSLARSISLSERALDLAREAGHVPVQAFVLTSLANVLRLIGKQERAQGHLEEAVRLYEGLGNRMGIARGLHVLGTLHWERGELEKAREILEASLAVMTGVRSRAEEIWVRSNLAGVLDDLGRETEARRHYERALANARAIRDPVAAAYIELYLAGLHAELGEYDDAIRVGERARETARRLGSGATLAEALTLLTEVYLAQGKHAEAVAMGREAVRRHGVLLRGFGEEEGASVRARYSRQRKIYQLGARAALALGSVRDVCFFLESGRAGNLLESLGGRDRMRAVTIPDEIREEESDARAAELRARRRIRERLSRGEEPTPEERRALLEAQTSVLRAIEKIQREAKSAAAVVYPLADSLEAIQGRLRPFEALVLYGLFGNDALALVVTPEEARVARLGAQEPIDRACRSLIRAGRRGARGVRPAGGSEPTVDPRDAEAALRKAVVEPLKLSPKITRVLVSPDGALTYVPFCLLLPDREVVHMPSGTVHGRLIAERGKSGKGVLALGNPVYGGRSEGATRATDFYGGVLSELPGTGREAVAVGDVVLLREAATETGLRKALASRERWRAVHLACHGIMSPTDPRLSALALSSDSETDGFLTCHELFEMKISADLVALSACETGTGKVYQSEGVVGLTGAFLYAGAPRVLCSLWKVDDDATRALMVRFYEAWKDGKTSAAAALREAQAHVRAQKGWEDPYFWAAWMLWGLPD